MAEGIIRTLISTPLLVQIPLVPPNKYISSETASMAYCWREVVIEDPGCLSGESVSRFMLRVQEALSAKYVAVEDIQGAVQGLRGRDGALLPWSDFVRLVSEAVQYDWAWFFLFRSDRKWNVKAQDIEKIKSSDAAVRLVDDQFIYFYTQNVAMVDVLSQNPIGIIRSNQIVDIDHVTSPTEQSWEV